MADSSGDKKHLATDRRRRQAREQGQVVKSQDLTSAALLLAALGSLWMLGGSAAASLAAAIEDVLDPQRGNGQAVVLLSDGAHNAQRGSARLAQVAEKARAMAVPLYTKTLGSDRGVRDLEVRLQRARELAFVGQPVPVTVELHSRGPLSGSVAVELLLDGAEVATVWAP